MTTWNELNSMGSSSNLSSDFFIDFSSSTGPLVSAAWMGTVLVLFGMSIPHSGEFTWFLHRVVGAYFLFSLCCIMHGSFFRSSFVQDLSFFDSFLQDSVSFRFFFFYSTSILMIFFFGSSSRYLFSKSTPSEFALIILFIHFGGLFLFRFSSFIDIFLALEIVTLASYVLVAFERQNRFSTYAAMQYFLMGSLPSASMLLGFSFFYLYGGSLVMQDLDMSLNTADVFIQHLLFNVSSSSNSNLSSFYEIYATASTAELQSTDKMENIMIENMFFNSNNFDSLVTAAVPLTSTTIIGFLFIMFNLFFKITAAPFHFWAPTVYGKAPIPSVTFLSIYSKVSVFFFSYTILLGFLHFANVFILFFFLFTGLLSIFMGSMGAFIEKSMKRFFVFSSSGHVGFSLAGLSSSTKEGFFSVFHYVPVYSLSSFLSWFILVWSGPSTSYSNQFSALKHNQPLMAVFFAFLLFSSSGIPPFAGFFVKLDMLAALFDYSQFFLNYMFFFLTVASFFYYLRAVKMLFFDETLKENTLICSQKNSNFENEYSRSNLQHWSMGCLVFFLLFYIVLVQKPLFLLQNESLFARY